MVKKLLIGACLILCMSDQALAAKQTLNTTDKSGVWVSKINSNTTELYEKAGELANYRPWLNQSTAPADTSIVWFDTTTSPAIMKRWNGSTWEAVTSPAGEVYTLPVATSSVLGGVKQGAGTAIAGDGTISVTAAGIGLGTSDNPSFNSVNASGGNLAAANKQVTKAWQTGLSYTASVTSVIHGDEHYIAKTTHTAEAKWEPGVGADWETAWKKVSGVGGNATAIDDLTDVDTTGKATGKILKFNSSGNLVVGDDSVGSGSVPSGTVNGQVLTWQTDAWVAGTAPWLTTASLGTGVATALGNAVDGTGGLVSKTALDLKANASNIGMIIGALADIKILTTAQPANGENWVDDTLAYGATEDNLKMWSIEKVGAELALKANASCFASESAFNACFDLTWVTGGSISYGTGVAAALAVAVDGTGGLASKAALDAISIGSPVVSAPTYSDSTCTTGQYAFSTSPSMYWCKATNTWDYQVVSGSALVWASWNNPTPATPTLTSRVIGTNGTTLTLTGSASLSVGSGGNGGFDVDCSTAGNNITATYSSGAPGTDLVYTLGTTVNSGDTCDLDYTQPGNGIEATTGGADLASITSGAITNNSTAGGGTILVGDNTVTTSSWTASSNTGSHYDIFTAVASGNIAKGYAALDASFGDQNCKMVVYNSTGYIVATSSATVVTTTAADFEFTFSSGSITSGNTYFLGTVCDGSVERGNSGVSWNSAHTAGTYATPTDPIDDLSGGGTGRGNLKIWITN